MKYIEAAYLEEESCSLMHVSKQITNWKCETKSRQNIYISTMSRFADEEIIIVIGEYEISELGIGEYGIGEHGIGEHEIGEHGIGEYGIGEHGIGEHGIGEYGIGEYGIGEYGIGEMLRHHPHISPLPPPHFYRPTPNHLCSYAPHAQTTYAQTTSIYHALPLFPHSEHPKDCTSLHFASYPSETHHTSISPSCALLSPGYADSQPSLPMSQSHMSTRSGHRP